MLKIIRFLLKNILILIYIYAFFFFKYSFLSNWLNRHASSNRFRRRPAPKWSNENRARRTRRRPKHPVDSCVRRRWAPRLFSRRIRSLSCRSWAAFWAADRLLNRAKHSCWRGCRVAIGNSYRSRLHRSRFLLLLLLFRLLSIGHYIKFLLVNNFKISRLNRTKLII